MAPEHVSDTVLAHMGKPPRAVYERFVQKYEQANEELGKRQYLVPYLMSSHTGSCLLYTSIAANQRWERFDWLTRPLLV